MAIFPAMVSEMPIFKVKVKRHWKLKWSGCLEREKMSSVLFIQVDNRAVEVTVKASHFALMVTMKNYGPASLSFPLDS
jgi:hypothetical protein